MFPKCIKVRPLRVSDKGGCVQLIPPSFMFDPPLVSPALLTDGQ